MRITQTRRSLALAVCLAVVALMAAGVYARRSSGARAARARELRVAAAADLGGALREIVPAFERESGATVRLTLGSTGLLARQAANGAPFDVLAAADEGYLLGLARSGRAMPGTCRLYAIGRLVVWTPPGRPGPMTLAELAQPRFRRVAIANPEHAPYGAAAREALQRAGVWPAVMPKLVYGANVQEAVRYAESGQADAAVVALSLVTGRAGRRLAVPARLYAPLRQAIGVLSRSHAPDLAVRFVTFVTGPTGRAVLRRYGFGEPGRDGPGSPGIRPRAASATREPRSPLGAAVSAERP